MEEMIDLEPSYMAVLVSCVLFLVRQLAKGVFISCKTYFIDFGHL